MINITEQMWSKTLVEGVISRQSLFLAYKLYYSVTTGTDHYIDVDPNFQTLFPVLRSGSTSGWVWSNTLNQQVQRLIRPRLLPFNNQSFTANSKVPCCKITLKLVYATSFNCRTHSTLRRTPYRILVRFWLKTVPYTYCTLKPDTVPYSSLFPLDRCYDHEFVIAL